MTTLERAVLFGLPTLSGLAVAFVLLGPGARRAVEGARVYGMPTLGARSGMIRVAVVERYGDLEVPAEGEVEVAWTRGETAIARATAQVDASGWADVELRHVEPLPEHASLTVSRKGRIVARGDVEARPPPVPVEAGACETSGPLTVCVPRGVAVPELPERVVVELRGGAETGAPASIVLDAPGAEVRMVKGGEVRRCEAGSCIEVRAFDVVARAPSVPLDVEVTGAVSVRHHGELPLRPGGFWLEPAEPDARELRVRSATPRTVAFASLVTREGRIWGGTVMLEEQPDGTASGRVRLPVDPRISNDEATLVLSSEPTEPKDRVVAWPVRSGVRVEPTTLVPLLDGAPAALVREDARIRSVRWPVAGAIAASAAALLVTLGLRIRRARERLERHLEGAGADAPITAPPLGLMVVVLALVAVALLVLAIVAAYA
jgi:hypothetical protein